MPDLSLLTWFLTIAVTASAAAVQGTVGIGYGLVAVPILALIDPSLAPVPQLLTAFPLTVVMAMRERSEIDFRGLGWMIAGRVPGAALGLALLTVATQRTLDVLIGGVVLFAVVVLGMGVTVRITKATQFAAGLASGATSLVAAIGGPPTALLYARERAPTLRSTMAAIFVFGLLFSIGVRGLSGNIAGKDLLIGLILLPAVLAGWGMSLRLKDRLAQSTVRYAVLGVSGLAAIGLLVRALG